MCTPGREAEISEIIEKGRSADSRLDTVFIFVFLLIYIFFVFCIGTLVEPIRDIAFRRMRIPLDQRAAGECDSGVEPDFSGSVEEGKFKKMRRCIFVDFFRVNLFGHFIRWIECRG